ncbi:unnamed protein product, partial [Rotaria sordida]
IFRENLIRYLEDIIKEDLSCFKNENIALDLTTIEKQNHTLLSKCSPILCPNDVNFDRENRAAICILASQNQIHHHTSTYYKYHKGSNTDNMSCRLRYPKELHDTTTINTQTGEILMRCAHPMKNNFNEWFLLACSYTDALDKSRRLILRCFNTLASQQEISSVQVAPYLMGWSDHYTSHTFVNIYVIGIERYLEQSLSKVTINYTNNNSSVINNKSSDILESVNEIDEVEDDEHLVLFNKRIDYELRPNELSHI